MEKILTKAWQYIFALLLFCLPFNLFYVLSDEYQYVNGIRVDYLIPKLFLTDILLVTLLILGGYLYRARLIQNSKNFFSVKKNTFLLLAVGFLVTAQFWSEIPLLSFMMIGRLMLLIAVGVIFVNIKKNFRVIYHTLTASVIFQSVFSLAQFIKQASITPYWLFGESRLSQLQTAGLQRETLLGQETILAYGTSPHPNVLAGIVVIFGLLIFNTNQVSQKLKIVVGLCLMLILFLTQSFSALLALLIGLILLSQKKKVSWNKLQQQTLGIFFSCILLLALAINITPSEKSNYSLERRAELNKAAVMIAVNHPITGVGLRTFTSVLENYTTSTELVRFIQPVHNIGILWLAETGIIGIVVIFALLRRKNNQTAFSPLLLALIPIAGLDHYLLTTQSGLLAGWIFLLLNLEKN